MDFDALFRDNLDLDYTDQFHKFVQQNDDADITDFFQHLHQNIKQVYCNDEIEEILADRLQSVYGSLPNYAIWDIAQYLYDLRSKGTVLTIKIDGFWYFAFLND